MFNIFVVSTIVVVIGYLFVVYFSLTVITIFHIYSEKGIMILESTLIFQNHYSLFRFFTSATEKLITFYIYIFFVGSSFYY